MGAVNLAAAGEVHDSEHAVPRERTDHVQMDRDHRARYDDIPEAAQRVKNWRGPGSARITGAYVGLSALGGLFREFAFHSLRPDAPCECQPD